MYCLKSIKFIIIIIGQKKTYVKNWQIVQGFRGCTYKWLSIYSVIYYINSNHLTQKSEGIVTLNSYVIVGL